MIARATGGKGPGRISWKRGWANVAPERFNMNFSREEAQEAQKGLIVWFLCFLRFFAANDFSR
jgi:hypothetical protein